MTRPPHQLFKGDNGWIKEGELDAVGLFEPIDEQKIPVAKA